MKGDSKGFLLSRHDWQSWQDCQSYRDTTAKQSAASASVEIAAGYALAMTSRLLFAALYILNYTPKENGREPGNNKKGFRAGSVHRKRNPPESPFETPSTGSGIAIRSHHLRKVGCAQTFHQILLRRRPNRPHGAIVLKLAFPGTNHTLVEQNRAVNCFDHIQQRNFLRGMRQRNAAARTARSVQQPRN